MGEALRNPQVLHDMSLLKAFNHPKMYQTENSSEAY